MTSAAEDLVSLAEIRAAQSRIAGTAARTPLIRWDLASLDGGPAELDPSRRPAIFLKNEAAQPIGSFKLRGAYNRIAAAALNAAEAESFRRGVITYSSGNHAQGVAYAARALGTRAVIVMPSNAPEVKRQATLALGAEVVVVGPASSERRLKAEELVREHGYLMVPPYDDRDIIAGQATCGVEILEQAKEQGVTLDLVLSPVSGGGLLSGVATGIARAAEDAGSPAPAVWGCEPELAADAHQSFYSRTLTEWPAAKTTRTLADGLRTQSLGERNFDHILKFVGGIVTVSEPEIRTALKLLLRSGIMAEPSGAVTLAAALFHRDQLPEARTIAVILSGGNIEPALLQELAGEEPVTNALS